MPEIPLYSGMTSSPSPIRRVNQRTSAMGPPKITSSRTATIANTNTSMYHGRSLPEAAASSGESSLNVLPGIGSRSPSSPRPPSSPFGSPRRPGRCTPLAGLADRAAPPPGEADEPERAARPKDAARRKRDRNERHALAHRDHRVDRRRVAGEGGPLSAGDAPLHHGAPRVRR